MFKNAFHFYRDDMEMMLNKIVPEGLPYRHSCEGPDDMVAIFDVFSLQPCIKLIEQVFRSSQDSNGFGSSCIQLSPIEHKLRSNMLHVR